MAGPMTVKRKGRIPTDYTVHPKDMMKVAVLVQADIQSKVREKTTPNGGAQTPNARSTVKMKGHSTPLISGRTSNHRFVDTRWDMHPGFGVVLLSLPKHGQQPSAWDVADWLRKADPKRNRPAYKPIMGISSDAKREVLDYMTFALRKMIAKQARSAKR